MANYTAPPYPHYLYFWSLLNTKPFVSSLSLSAFAQLVSLFHLPVQL